MEEARSRTDDETTAVVTEDIESFCYAASTFSAAPICHSPAASSSSYSEGLTAGRIERLETERYAGVRKEEGMDEGQVGNYVEIE